MSRPRRSARSSTQKRYTSQGEYSRSSSVASDSSSSSSVCSASNDKSIFINLYKVNSSHSLPPKRVSTKEKDVKDEIYVVQHKKIMKQQRVVINYSSSDNKKKSSRLPKSSINHRKTTGMKKKTVDSPYVKMYKIKPAKRIKTKRQFLLQRVQGECQVRKYRAEAVATLQSMKHASQAFSVDSSVKPQTSSCQSNAVVITPPCV